MPNESKTSIQAWFLGFASVLLVIALGVLFKSAGDLTEAAVNFKNLTVKQPRFADFVGAQRYELLLKKASKRPVNNLTEKVPASEVKASTPVSAQRLDQGQAVQKAFEFFADYENKLSKPDLQIIKPVVAALEPGSFAELAGVKLGDSILSIGQTKLESVMGFYSALSEKPTAEFAMRISRDKRELNLFVRASKGISFTGNNTGIKFALPQELVYITEQDAKKLAEQYKADFMATIPSDWRTDVTNNLMQMAQQLSNLGKEFVDLNSAKPVRVKTSDLIVWQHKRWIESLEDYFSQRRVLESKVIDILSGLGDAASGFVAALLLFGIALLSYLYSRSSRQKSSA